MNNLFGNLKKKKAVLLALLLPLMFSSSPVQAMQGAEETKEVAQQNQQIISAKKINPTTVEILLSGNQRMAFDFYGENIFRLFRDNTGGLLREPEANLRLRS